MDSDDTNMTNMSNLIFNKTNLVFILWFLAIYIISYCLLRLIFTKSNEVSNFQLKMSRGIDFIVLVFLFLFISALYFFNPESKREIILQNTLHSLNSFIKDPISIISMVFFLILFYVIIYLFNIPMMNGTKPFTVSIIETTAWIIFVIICFVDFFKYIMNVDLIDLLTDVINIDNLPSRYTKVSGNVVATGIKGNTIVNTTKNISGNVVIPTSQPQQKNEVFNISNNLYTYDDAQAICSAYGATLANYEQIEDAYKNGGEWCNYGWSDGQMALFPTQKSTWDTLQKTTDKKNNCGRPGINGGYFANPYIKFGVNCYGKKPAATDADLNRMAANKDIIVPKTLSDIALDAKVQFWKNNAGNLLVINSFDRTQWSEY
jgi:hypothetical protein